ncbi:hypothetical protein P152DRAFT_73110 [Eremomyces bilateralis CBS 781.70]|uniref:Secreted protein n=1 Tax=Eremomyces bilateralis CBS 781.70 TaxID=1392243 RepID=A0A6G1FYQ8_9PEZI|nr:uncharacterized protein P152DRAFT_73110 [Eremomyces bilateralis CBS 781.70]KAF1810977.1 hypothetical protein P152DRAFT_73110 [Eremomyces bilateralis CBS 781.70]
MLLPVSWFSVLFLHPAVAPVSAICRRIRTGADSRWYEWSEGAWLAWNINRWKDRVQSDTVSLIWSGATGSTFWVRSVRYMLCGLFMLVGCRY